jgi:hypothetical protein
MVHTSIVTRSNIIWWLWISSCYLTGCRMVSLFDTRVKIDDHCLITVGERGVDTSGDNKDIPAARLGPEDKMLLDTDDESNDDMLGERNHRSFKNRRVNIHEEVKEEI